MLRYPEAGRERLIIHDAREYSWTVRNSHWLQALRLAGKAMQMAALYGAASAGLRGEHKMMIEFQNAITRFERIAHDLGAGDDAPEYGTPWDTNDER